MNVKTLAIPLLILGLIIGALFWLGTHSIINIKAGSGEVSYAITGDDGKTETIKTAEDTRKLVRTGHYQITARRDEDSQLQFVKARSFLRSAVFETNLTHEISRTFVGDNPGSCMYLLAGQLLSSDCQSSADKILQHEPATASLSTYTDSVPTNTLTGKFLGMAATKNGSYIALTQDTELAASYYLQTVSPGLVGGQRYLIPGTVQDDTYSLKAYADGVVVSNPSLTYIRYFASASAAPERIDFASPKDKDYQPYYLTVQPDSVTQLYSRQAQEDEEGQDADYGERSDVPAGAIISVYRDGKQQQYTFDDEIATIAATCGSQKVCLTDPRGMNVYDISNKNPHFLYRINDVTDTISVGTTFYAVTSTGVIRLDADAATGSYDYTFGSYKYCGAEPAGQGYLLCIITDKGKSSALYMQPGQSDQYSIDKKVADLATKPGIDDISANRQFVTITPSIGELEYDPASGLNLPNPSKTAAANAAIRAAVSKSGIDSTVYTVVNLGE